MKNFDDLGMPLNRAQLKQITGGKTQMIRSCSCIGSVGAWTYSGDGGSLPEAGHDILTYCRSGQGSCIPVGLPA